MPVAALPEFVLDPALPLGSRFTARGLSTYHAAAEHVWRLPYGRTSDRADYRRVLAEGRGTRSSKHALLAALAREHERPVQLMLGIYEMSERNTPGIGSVLQRYGLSCIPEAHCYLVHRGTRVDLTRTTDPGEPIAEFLTEEPIAPEQIGRHKTERHQQFLRAWAAQHGRQFEAVWQAREACIAALAAASLA